MKTLVYIATTKALENAETFSSLYKTVPKYRQKKIDTYKTDKEKRLCLGVGLLLSRALKENEIDESLLELSHKDNGRPFFKERPDIYFSLSHSEERVMCSISDQPIGCDVEIIKEDSDKDVVNWTKMECYAKASDTNMMDLINGKAFYSKEYSFKEIEQNDGYRYVICSKCPLEENQIIRLESF